MLPRYSRRTTQDERQISACPQLWFTNPIVIATTCHLAHIDENNDEDLEDDDVFEED